MNAHDPEAAAGEPVEIPPVTSFEDFERETVALMTGPFKPHFGGKAVYDFMSGRPTRDWLLKGVFLAHTLFLAIGEPGCGKSYLMLDFVMTRALAIVDARAPREWFGRKFKPGGSVFIAAEGQEDFLIRIHAWLVAKGLPPDFKLPVWLVPTAIDMRSSDADAKTLIADIKNIDTYFRGEFGCGVDFVAVDTFNRALAGGDDTKPEHVGAFIRNSALIREQTGCTVGAVHHTPRGAERARGHSSVTADNDAEIFIRAALAGAPNSWTVTRNKAGPKGERHEFRLRQQEVGRDEDGDAVTACYVVPGAYEGSIEGVEMHDAALAAQTRKAQMTADGRSILGGNLTIVMRALHELIEREGVDPPPDVRAPHGRRAATMKRWLDEIVRAMPGDDKDDAKFRDKCRKARDDGAVRLRNRGIIGMDGDHVWRTSKRVAMVDKAEVDRQASFPETGGDIPSEADQIPF
jgi:hypothetical protein